MTQNLGLVKLVHTGTNPPVNTMMIWFDSNTGVNIHKYYDVPSTSWLPLHNDVILFYANVGSFPLSGSAGFLYVAQDSNLIYSWSGGVYVLTGGNDFWYVTTDPANIRHDGKVSFNTDPIEAYSADDFSFVGKATMMGESDVNNQMLIVLDADFGMIPNGATGFAYNPSASDTSVQGNQAFDVLVKPDMGFGFARPVKFTKVGSNMGTGLTSNTQVIMTPQTMDGMMGPPLWAFNAQDNAGNPAGYFGFDFNNGFGTSYNIAVGDLSPNNISPSNGMIRWNGSNFQGYKGGWVDLDSSGGGLPMGSSYQALLLDAFNNPYWGDMLKDGSGVDSVDYWNRNLIDENSLNSVQYNNRYLSNGSDVSVDWGNFYLFDVSGVISLDWTNRALVDSSGVGSILYQTRYLMDSMFVNSIDWGQRKGFDSSNIYSYDWENRNLINSAGRNVVSWDTSILNDGSAASLNWSVRQLYDNGENLSEDWNQRKLYDGAGGYSLDWQGRGLYDSSFIQSADYNARQLFHSNGTPTIDWYSCVMRNSSYQQVLDWGGSLLEDTSGNISIDWENRRLKKSGWSVLDWYNQNLNDSSGALSASWSSRHLVDPFGNICVDWTNKQLLNNAGATTVEWGTCILQDSLSRDSVRWSDRQLYDLSNFNSLDWQARILYDNIGAALVDWHSGFKQIGKWGFNNQTPDFTNTGWTATATFSSSKTFSSSATVTLTQLADVVATLIGELRHKGILSV